MADKLMRAQVTIPLDSAIPEDYIVNTWYFDGDDALGVQPESDYHDRVVEMLETFYTSIDQLIFPGSVTETATLKIYDMRDPEIRVPEVVTTFELDTSASDPLPNETALCLSFRAEYESGVNPQRRRGRIYLGPIAVGATEVVGGQVRPSAAARTLVADAAGVMQDGLLLNIGDPERVRWSVYSPTTDAGAPIDDAFNDVVAGWVDDALDTQRRRGPAPTARTTF